MSDIEVLEETNAIEQAEERIESLLSVSLPISRVKKICRLDPEMNMINQEAVRMITKATEIFIAEFAKACYTQAVIDKRKTVQPKDLDKVIKNNWLYEFLEDALDGWPEPIGRMAMHVSSQEEHANDDDELPDTIAITEDIMPEYAPLEDVEPEDESQPLETDE